MSPTSYQLLYPATASFDVQKVIYHTSSVQSTPRVNIYISRSLACLHIAARSRQPGGLRRTRTSPSPRCAKQAVPKSAVAGRMHSAVHQGYIRLLAFAPDAIELVERWRNRRCAQKLLRRLNCFIRQAKGDAAAGADASKRRRYCRFAAGEQLLRGKCGVRRFKCKKPVAFAQSEITLSTRCMAPSMSYMLLTVPVFRLSVRP